MLEKELIEARADWQSHFIIKVVFIIILIEIWRIKKTTFSFLTAAIELGQDGLQ